MSLKKRMLAFVLSAAVALCPALSLAEGISSYYAGEMTGISVSRSYTSGQQIDMSMTFDLELEDGLNSARAKALDSLLEKSRLDVSLYDDAGTAHVHAAFLTDGVKLLDVNALIYQDGSVQAMTNLTGKTVLALPAGTFSMEGISFESLLYGEVMPEEEGADVSSEASAFERLRSTASDVGVMIFSHLLGWVSYTQRDTGELYVFDDTYLEPTDTRDGVAQRMIGTIQANEFNTLLYNVTATICDQYGDFQQAIADCLAELGVTRAQVRTVVDSLLTEETIDPALDWVEPSYYIVNEPDGSLCTYDDVSYFFKKLMKCTDKIWTESLDSTLSLIVSYDDYGTMVGLDAELPKFTENLPYEGMFTYSLKTDDYWQSKHTAHGELELLDGKRLVGDLTVFDGEDVDSVNNSYANGYLELRDQNVGTSIGVDVDSKLDYEVRINEQGQDEETYTGTAVIGKRENGESLGLLRASVDGVTTTDGKNFELTADASVEAVDLAKLNVNVTVASGEVEENAFTGGQAVDLTAMDEAQLESIKQEVISQGIGLSVSLITHPTVLTDIMTLLGQ